MESVQPHNNALTTEPASSSIALPASTCKLENISLEIARRIFLTQFSLTHGTLSVRELEIMLHTVDGAAGKEIAHRIGISPGTVKVHQGHYRAKLGVSREIDVVRIALLSLLEK